MKNISFKERGNLEIHSEPVREIMGQIPGWIIRWGLTLLFGIFLIIVFGSYFFKYPETITVPIIITTVNPPAELICRVSGKIQKFFVEDGQIVESGSMLAVIENTADFDNYLILKNEMTGIDTLQDWGSGAYEHENTLMLSLGDIQNSFEAFKKNWNSFRSYLLAGFVDRKITLIKQQIENQEEYKKILQQQRLIQGKDFELTKNRVTRDSSIFAKGGLSEKEYETEKQQLMQKEAALKGYEASINNAQSSLLSMKQNILELQFQKQDEISKYKMLLDESKQTLETAVRRWEELYLITSPVDGKITFTKFWSENQVVTTGDRLATVIPSGETKIIGRCVIPRSGFGMVSTGQKVNIKLSGFPYLEYGMLTGYISSVSLVPEQEGYLAEIELPQGMLTSYSESLRFIHEMDGTADIITRETRAISRFFNPVRSLLNE